MDFQLQPHVPKFIIGATVLLTISGFTFFLLSLAKKWPRILRRQEPAHGNSLSVDPSQKRWAIAASLVLVASLACVHWCRKVVNVPLLVLSGGSQFESAFLLAELKAVEPSLLETAHQEQQHRWGNRWDRPDRLILELGGERPFLIVGKQRWADANVRKMLRQWSDKERDVSVGSMAAIRTKEEVSLLSNPPFLAIEGNEIDPLLDRVPVQDCHVELENVHVDQRWMQMLVDTSHVAFIRCSFDESLCVTPATGGRLIRPYFNTLSLDSKLLTFLQHRTLKSSVVIENWSTLKLSEKEFQTIVIEYVLLVPANPVEWRSAAQRLAYSPATVESIEDAMSKYFAEWGGDAEYFRLPNPLFWETPPPSMRSPDFETDAGGRLRFLSVSDDSNLNGELSEIDLSMLHHLELGSNFDLFLWDLSESWCFPELKQLSYSDTANWRGSETTEIWRRVLRMIPLSQLTFLALPVTVQKGLDNYEPWAHLEVLHVEAGDQLFQNPSLWSRIADAKKLKELRICQSGSSITLEVAKVKLKQHLQKYPTAARVWWIPQQTPQRSWSATPDTPLPTDAVLISDSFLPSQ